MKLVRSALSVWLKFGSQLFVWLGGLLIVVVIGAAIYAQWIHPEAAVNDVVNQLLGKLPVWVWYVVLAVGLPMILLLVASILMTPTIMIFVVTLPVNLARATVWVYRRLASKE